MSWFFEKADQIQRTDDWDFYFCRVDDKPAFIFLDLGRRAKIPATGYPLMAYLRVYLRHPREDGLSSDEQFPILSKMKDILTHVIERAGSVYVGRKTGNGTRDYYFYTPKAAGFEKAAQRAMRSFPAYDFEKGTRQDEAWLVYQDFLYPNPSAMSVIQNRRVVAILEREGDDPTVVHKLDHRAYFPSDNERLDFSNRVIELGYQIEPGNRDTESGTIFLDFFRMDMIGDIDSVTTEIDQLLEETGGDYDGWGTSVEKSSNDTPS